VGQASGTAAFQGEMVNQELTAAIQTTFTKSKGPYGAPRIQAELKSTGMACSLNRVARLMRKADIRARRQRLFQLTTTNSRYNYLVAPNTLNRQFWVAGPNGKWTYTDLVNMTTTMRLDMARQSTCHTTPGEHKRPADQFGGRADLGRVFECCKGYPSVV
jgi:hypothetical protein